MRTKEPRSDVVLVRRLRRKGWRGSLHVGRFVWSLLVVGIVLLGKHGQSDDQHIVDTQPAVQAVVSKVSSFPRGGHEVYVRLDGRELMVWDADSLDHRPEVGDVIRVAADPHDRSYLVAVDGRQGWWYSTSAAWVYCLVGVAVVWGIGVKFGAPRPLLTALRAPSVSHGTVVSRKSSGGTRRVDVDLGERTLSWFGDSDAPVPEQGAACRLVGDVRPDGWAVLVIGRSEEWATAPLEER